MSAKSAKRNEFHELDPVVRFGDAIRYVEEAHPWAGPQSELARMLGVTRALVHLWSLRDDGLIPPPWNWRLNALLERGVQESSTIENGA